jgi:beta-galactosidase
MIGSIRQLRLSVAGALIMSLFLGGVQAREKTLMNGLDWKFKKADVAGAQATAFVDAAWATIKLPHDFNGGIDGVNNDMFNGPSQYRGPGWYRTHFTVAATNSTKKVFLEFEGVALVADVYVNGTLIGQHKGGYTAFTMDITAAVNFAGDNVLAVKANSANDPTVAPWMNVPFGSYPTSYDYGLYGGIYRDVSLIITDKLKIEATFHSTPSLSAASSLIKNKVEVKNYDAAAKAVTLQTIVLDAQNVEVKRIESVQTIAASETFIFEQTSTALATPHLWSPSDPYLYTVRTIALVGGVEVDRVESKLGFRWFELKLSSPFKLNGSNLFLRGVNRHQDRAGFGYALTDEQTIYDIALIKSAGFNFLRHSHYPADPSVMRACDSLGIIMWLEIPMTVSMSTNPAFKTNVVNQLTEMVRQNYNHPCVVVWGVGNESDQNAGSAQLSEAYSNEVHSALNAQAHALDDTRPTTGCNWKLVSNHSKVDVYSPQEWSGWYGGNYVSYNPTQLIGEYGADAGINVHKENGGANSDWSQEYQCRLLEYKVSKGEQNADECPGHCVWIAFDFASPRTDRTIAKGNTIDYMNQKGLFTHDRIPKDAYYFYKSFQTSGKTAPMVYIVSHTWLDRWTAPAAKNVWAYSNCDSVELFNDLGSASLSFGKRARTWGELQNTRYSWNNANVKYNVLYAIGYVGGQPVARDTIVLKNLPPPPPVGTIARKGSVRLTPLNILTSAAQCRSVSIYSTNGQMVRRNVQQNTVRQMSDLPHGMYVIKYITADGISGNLSYVKTR